MTSRDYKLDGKQLTVLATLGLLNKTLMTPDYFTLKNASRLKIRNFKNLIDDLVVKGYVKADVSAEVKSRVYELRPKGHEALKYFEDAIIKHEIQP